MTRTRPVSIGVIGCGTIAYWKHLRNLKRMPGVRITGLADPDCGALARAGRMVDAPAFFSVDELLASVALDAVVVASPTSLHAAHLAQARAAGKHVYLEKPIAHDAASLSSIQPRAAANEPLVAVGYNLRFHPACRLLRQHLRAGLIGDIHAITSHFAEPADCETMPGWKRERALGGGVLLDLGTHHIDLYRWLLQDELVDITAAARSRLFEQDSACIQATTRGNVDLCGYFSFTSSRSHQMTVHGSAGVLHADLHSGVIRAERKRRLGYGVSNRALPMGIGDYARWLRKRFQPSYDPSFALALRAFAGSVAAARQWHADLATASDGAAAVRAVLDAEAAAGGEWRSGR